MRIHSLQMNFKTPAAMPLLYRNIAVAALFAIIAWLAYFQLCSGLGLYQDDAFMYHLVRGMREGVLREAFDLSRSFGGEGRPGTQVIMVLFTWAGSALGGVTGLYILGWILLSALGMLAFLTLRQLFSPATSLLAASFYVLYPADSAKFFAVTYMANIGAALFWIAAWLLLKGRAAAAALVLASTFVMGEAFILPGALLPLLLLADARRELKSAARTALRFLIVYGAIIVPAIALRLLYAPGRAADAVGHTDRIAQMGKMFASMYFGVIASASSFPGHAMEFRDSANSQGWTVALSVAILLWVTARWLARVPTPAVPAIPATGVVPLRAGFLVAFGLLAWAASYPLSGLYPPRFPPTVLIGKLSNVHGQGAMGATILVACALWALERAAGARQWLQRVTAGAMALFLGLLAGYFLQVQERYVDNWKFQLSFWRQLPAAVPELNAQSLVVVETVGDESTRLDGVSPFDWSMTYLYPLVWQTPAEWPTAPLFMTKYFWDTTVRDHGDRVEVVGYPTLATRSFAKADVVRLRVESGRFTRVDSKASAEARVGFPLSQDSLASRRWASGPLLLRADGLSSTAVTPNNYSDETWKSGIASSGRSFYFLVDYKDSNPVRVGSTLRFARSGNATATHVDVVPQGSVYAVFVAVDRQLDPSGDGYPHAVRVSPPR